MRESFNNIFPSNILAFISDRREDFTPPPNSTNLNDPQKLYLKDFLKRDIGNVFNIRQVHGDGIIELRQGCDPFELAGSEADGVITNEKNIPVAVRTADCLSLFLYDPTVHVIAVVHAGWKGTRGGISQKAVHAMMRDFGCDASSIMVSFGPAIHSCCYEVSLEFKKYFPKYVSERDGHFYMDLPQANRDQLTESGVKEEHITRSLVCTCCSDEYFSYRREGKKAGRMISLMMITN